MDSFKGSLSSMEAGRAVKAGILKACPGAQVVVKPLADGGEGTTEALVEGLEGEYAQAQVTGPLGEPVTARYGIWEDGKRAVLEMAKASGITLAKTLDPWRASTYGVGEMLLDGIRRGCRDFIIGIGGSATTEGGIGMLSALGYRFYSRQGELLPPVFSSLGKVAQITAEDVPEELKDCRFQIASDVTNPLCGEKGAVYVFGPQKGVKSKEREPMDQAMAHYAEKIAEFTGKDCRAAAGAGAAGGLGFAFLSCLPGVTLRSGVDMVVKAVGLEDELRDADVAVTGEGRLDAQTAMGKAPVGVARLAKKYGCRVVALAGSVAPDAGKCHEEGIDAFFPIVRGAVSLEEAMRPENAGRNMALCAEQVFRLMG